MPGVREIFSSHLGKFSSCRGGKRRKGEKKKGKKKEEKEIKRIIKERRMKGEKKRRKKWEIFQDEW